MNFYDLAESATSLAKYFYETYKTTKGDEEKEISVGVVYYKYIASIIDQRFRNNFHKELDFPTLQTHLLEALEKHFGLLPGTLKKDLRSYSSEQIKDTLHNLARSDFQEYLDNWCEKANEEFDDEEIFSLLDMEHEWYSRQQCKQNNNQS